MGKLSGDYLPAERQPTGIAVCSAASFAGMLLALALGLTLGGHGHIQRLLVFEGLLGIPAALALALALRRPGVEEKGGAVAIEQGAVRRLWGMSEMRTLCGLVFVGFGVFVALTTWLQTLLDRAGVSEQTAAALLIGMVVAGIVGCAIVPERVDRSGTERTFLRAAVLASALGCVALALITLIGPRAVVIVVMGFALLPALPIVLTAAERLAGTLFRRHRRRDRFDGRQSRRAGDGTGGSGSGPPPDVCLPGNGRGDAGGAAAGRALSAYSPSCLPRISFMISSVPPPIGPRRASRTARSIPYSRMYP